LLTLGDRSPLTTPDGLADPAGAVAALEVAAAKVEATWCAGRSGVMSSSSGGVNLPANGAEDPLGVFRTLWFAPTKDSHFTSQEEIRTLL